MSFPYVVFFLEAFKNDIMVVAFVERISGAIYINNDLIWMRFAHGRSKAFRLHMRTAA